jgi:salicylate hydroxylase
MDLRQEVAIVGAGIAGMSLAIACRQSGLQVRLYEQHAGRMGADDLLEITPNGSRVLHALGLKSALMDVSLIPDFSTVRSARTGFLLSQRALGAFSEARYGASSYLIRASDLKALLWQTCEEAGIPMTLEARVAEIDTAAATLTTTSGAAHSHLAVAVATGQPGSDDLSGLLESRTSVEDGEITLIRGVATRAKPQRDHRRFMNTWLIPGGFLTERPIPQVDDRPQQVELFAVVAAPRPDSPPAEALAALLHRSHSSIESLTDDLTATYVRETATPPSEHWHGGRTVLLGGICHAPPPHSSYGPSAMMEDAWILSRMMERWEEEPHQDFAAFERFRKPRARRLRTHANAELQTLTLTRPSRIWQRNLAWSLTSRFLPEITMEKLDWLYGYDCIKGFA